MCTHIRNSPLLVTACALRFVVGFLVLRLRHSLASLGATVHAAVPKSRIRRGAPLQASAGKPHSNAGTAKSRISFANPGCTLHAHRPRPCLSLWRRLPDGTRIYFRSRPHKLAATHRRPRISEKSTFLVAASPANIQKITIKKIKSNGTFPNLAN